MRRIRADAHIHPGCAASGMLDARIHHGMRRIQVDARIQWSIRASNMVDARIQKVDAAPP
jgi:hypothetical protein